nr:mitochondrial protoporphyrinogen IX oxidase [Tanacetum cinerariifolium]
MSNRGADNFNLRILYWHLPRISLDVVKVKLVLNLQVFDIGFGLVIFGAVQSMMSRGGKKSSSRNTERRRGSFSFLGGMQDKELISNVVGYATRVAAHKELSTCLLCCKKTCDNAQLAQECLGKHHSRPGPQCCSKFLFCQTDKELISNVVGYATRVAAHKELSTCLLCCKKTCDNAQLAQECPGKHHRWCTSKLKTDSMESSRNIFTTSLLQAP